MGRRKRIEAEAAGRRVSGEPNTRRAPRQRETPSTGKRFEVAQKVALLEEFEHGSESLRDFCARQHFKHRDHIPLAVRAGGERRRELGAPGKPPQRSRPPPTVRSRKLKPHHVRHFARAQPGEL